MSDPVKIALITGITVAVPPLVIGVLNYLNSRRRETTMAEIHTLVNSQMGEQLLIGMVSRTLAETTPTSENKILAAAAEEKYRQHQERQARVDGRK